MVVNLSKSSVTQSTYSKSAIATWDSTLVEWDDSEFFWGYDNQIAASNISKNSVTVSNLDKS